MAVGRHILWFDEIGEQDTLAVGGKAVNLARLRRAGLNVPNGFVLTTAAFDEAEHDVTRAEKEKIPVAKLAKSFGGQPKVLATSATVGMNSSAARLSLE